MKKITKKEYKKAKKIVENYEKQQQEEKIKKEENTFSHKEDDDLNDGNALDGMTVSQWEQRNGRGFWGNPTTGFVYDKDNQ